MNFQPGDYVYAHDEWSSDRGPIGRRTYLGRIIEGASDWCTVEVIEHYQPRIASNGLSVYAEPGIWVEAATSFLEQLPALEQLALVAD